MSITITTDHGPVYFKSNGIERPVRCYLELDEATRAEFYYVDDAAEADPRFFEYRGSWYDLHDGFGQAPDYMKARGFDGCQPESAFSAVVVKWFDAEGTYLPAEGSIIVGYIHW